MTGPVLKRAALLLGLAAVPAFSQGPSTIELSWSNYGANAQHTSVSRNASSPLEKVRWSADLDDERSYYGSAILAHFASPCITKANTLVHAYRYTNTVNGRNNWRIIARSGVTGAEKWSLNTDFRAPVVYPSGWTTVFPLAIAGIGSTLSVVAGGYGGSVWIRNNPDSATGAVRQVFFYQPPAGRAKFTPFANVKICTPLTTDRRGNIYFGYTVNGPLSPSASASLGKGGIACVTLKGDTFWRPVSDMGLPKSVTRPALNAAPALSIDEGFLYAAVTDPGQRECYLVKLTSNGLIREAKVRLIDPSNGNGARLIDQSSAAPMVGPDGHVFMGVFGYFWRESHGWMLQFDKNLNPNNSAGKRYPVGAFGWDDTPSVVTSSLVPSYSGRSSYLILSKYNNYAIGSGDGVNQLAVLDPSTDTLTKDRQTGIGVMTEVLTVVGPTPDPEHVDANHPNAVREWCINAAAVDPYTKSAIVNCEDGILYRWSFTTNTLVQAITLAEPTGEAYTSTAIGPDGTCYAINNSILHAVGKL